MKNIQNRGKSALGIDANRIALLAYTFVFVAPILVFTEKDNKFVRFHALQSSLWAVICLGCFLGVPLIGMLLANFLIRSGTEILSGIVMFLAFLLSFVSLSALLGGLVFASIKASLGVEYKLPIVGRIAHKLVQFI